MCKALLRRLLKHPKEQILAPQPAPERVPRKWWQFPFRVTNTSRGWFNMPKFQPCPSCRAGAKRQFKSELGATYKCRCGRTFAVGRRIK